MPVQANKAWYKPDGSHTDLGCKARKCNPDQPIDAVIIPVKPAFGSHGAPLKPTSRMIKKTKT